MTDLVAARPIHLSLIDAIETMNGAEGPWGARQGLTLDYLKPGVLIAGLNPVCSDAAGTAIMGFDPMAERGTAPFELCDNTMQLAEAKGIGSRDLDRIEVIGAQIKDVRFPFRRS